MLRPEFIFADINIIIPGAMPYFYGSTRTLKKMLKNKIGSFFVKNVFLHYWLAFPNQGLLIMCTIENHATPS